MTAERTGAKIGIIGSGMIGGTAARLFARGGHSVAISNRRGAASLAGLLSEIGPLGNGVPPVSQPGGDNTPTKDSSVPSARVYSRFVGGKFDER